MLAAKCGRPALWSGTPGAAAFPPPGATALRRSVRNVACAARAA